MSPVQCGLIATRVSLCRSPVTPCTNEMKALDDVHVDRVSDFMGWGFGTARDRMKKMLQ